MGDHQHQLVMTLKQAQRPLFVDAGVLNLVDEDNGAVAEQGDVGDHQRPGLAAAELVQALAQGNRLRGDLIGQGQHLHRRGLLPPALGMEGQELFHRGVQHEAHILPQVGHQLGRQGLAAFRRDLHAVQEHPAAGDRVPMGQLLYILDEPGLPGAGVAHDGTQFAPLQGDALEGFRLPGLVPAGKNGHRLHTSASSKLILPTTPCWNALPTRCSPTQ